MAKIKINKREISLDKEKILRDFLKEVNLIPECVIALKNENIMGMDEKIKKEDEIEILTFGWENL